MKFKSIFVLFLFTFPLFSQELSLKTADWSNVLNGKCITEPESNKNGIVFLTEGRTIYEFNEDGKLLFEKDVKINRKSLQKCTKDGFIFIISKNGYSLSLLNPNGIELWNKEFSWQINSKPVFGRDGRIFVKGDENLACFGMNGICKWEFSIPVYEKNKIFEIAGENVFISDIQNSVLISPYGEILNKNQIPKKDKKTELMETYKFNETSLITFQEKDDFYFLCDNQKALICNSNNEILWQADFSKTDKINYALITQNNNLLLAFENWTIASWKTGIKNSQKNEKSSDYASISNADSSFSTINSIGISESLSSTDRIEALRNGFYGKNEFLYSQELIGTLNSYIDYNTSSNFGIKPNQTAFKQAPEQMDNVLKQVSLFGTDTFSLLSSKLISSEKDSSYLYTLCNGLSECGYDKDLRNLQALEKVYQLPSLSNSAQIKICEAVSSICCFMGNEAYRKYGKKILSFYLHPDFNIKVREAARRNLIKLAEFNSQKK